MPTYNPKKVTISVGATTVIARGESTFVKASRNSEAVSLKVSSDGLGTRTINVDKSGKIEITLLNSSPVNDVFTDLALQDEDTNDGVEPITIADGTGTAKASAQEAWITKMPDLERAKELGETTWVFETEDLDLQPGGTTAP